MATPVERKDEIFAWFMEDPQRTFRNCSAQFDVPYETVRGWGKTEAWYQKRIKQAEFGELPDGVADQADAIRLVLVRRIVLGLDLTPDSLSELVKTWHSIVAIGVAEDPGVDRDSILGELEQ